MMDDLLHLSFLDKWKIVLVIDSLKKEVMKSSGFFSVLEYCSQYISWSSP